MTATRGVGPPGKSQASREDQSETPLADGMAHLVAAESAQHFRQSMMEGVEWLASRIARTTQPLAGSTPDELRPLVDTIDLDRPLATMSAALDELEQVYTANTTHSYDPAYAAHLNSSVVTPAVLGETIMGSINTSMDTWYDSAGATLIEEKLVQWAAEQVGFGPSRDGVFTSGGTQSNLQALLIAREIACAAVRRREPGTRKVEVLPRLRILTSEHAHYSVERSAELLGIGSESVVPLSSDEHARMCPLALGQELRACAREGTVVMAIVATAGTTDFGSIDPLPTIADLCREYGTWLHVDAAYGGGLLLSRQRSLLTGIEEADSVTVDFHKMYYQPISSSALLVNDRKTLRHVTYHADYLNPAEDTKPNLVDKSLQTTRRFDALKLWLTIRIMGTDALGAMVDAVIDLAKEVWCRIEEDPRFHVVLPPVLSTLVFRYEPADSAPVELVDAANLHAKERLLTSGKGAVAATVVVGRRYLKFTLLNPRATVDDLVSLLDMLAVHAGDFLARHGVAT